MDRDGDRSKPDELASSAARGYAIAMQVIGASALMVVFPLSGRWVDGKLGTGVLFLLIGFAIGFYAAISQLIRISASSTRRKF